MSMRREYEAAGRGESGAGEEPPPPPPARIDHIIASIAEESTERMRDLVFTDDQKIPFSGEMITGRESVDLIDAAREFTMPKYRISGLAATHGETGTSPSQDRAVVVPDAGVGYVIDGVGGMAYGHIAASCIGMTVLQFPRDPADSFTHAAQKNMKRLNKPNAAALAGFEIHESEKRRFARLNRAGDSRAMIFRDGRILASTVDENYPHTLGFSEDDSLFCVYRNMLSNSLSSAGAPPDWSNPVEADIEAGDIIIACTDGITGGLTNDEIGSLIKGRPIADSLVILRNVLLWRFKNEKILLFMLYLSWMHDSEKKQSGESGYEMPAYLLQKARAGSMTNEDMGTAAECILRIPDPERKTIWEKSNDLMFSARRHNGIFPDGFRAPPVADNMGIVIAEVLP